MQLSGFAETWQRPATGAGRLSDQCDVVCRLPHSNKHGPAPADASRAFVQNCFFDKLSSLQAPLLLRAVLKTGIPTTAR